MEGLSLFLSMVAGAVAGWSLSLVAPWDAAALAGAAVLFALWAMITAREEFSNRR